MFGFILPAILTRDFPVYFYLLSVFLFYSQYLFSIYLLELIKACVEKRESATLIGKTLIFKKIFRKFLEFFQFIEAIYNGWALANRDFSKIFHKKTENLSNVNLI